MTKPKKKILAWAVKWPNGDYSRTFKTKAETVETACRFFPAGQKIVLIEIKEVRKK